MPKVIIAFCGKAGCGKDSSAEYMIKEHGFTRMAFADQIKKVARQLGWDGKKDDRGRKLLQVLGTEVGRAYDTNMWVKKAMNSDEFVNSDFVAVTDCRFPNEVKALEEVGAIMVKITGRGGLEGEAANHPSEIAIDDYDGWHYHIDNSGGFRELYAQLSILASPECRAALEKEKWKSSVG